MKITSLSKQLSTAEVAAVAQIMSELYSSGQPVAKDAFLANLMTELNSLSVNLATAIDRRAEKSLLSESVSKLDASCRAFNSLLKHYMQSSDLTMKLCAKQLAEVLKKHGGMRMLNHGSLAKVGKVEALLADLASESVESLVRQLPRAAESVAEMGKCCNDVEQCIAVETGKNAQQGSLLPAGQIKSQLLQLINGRLIVYLKGKAIENPDNYTQFANNVVALIAKANSRVYANKKSDAETSGSEPGNTEPQIGIAG